MIIIKYIMLSATILFSALRFNRKKIKLKYRNMNFYPVDNIPANFLRRSFVMYGNRLMYASGACIGSLAFPAWTAW